jgi:hypothetical protein
MALCSTCSSIPFRPLDRLYFSDAKTQLAAGLENVLWLDVNGGELDEDNPLKPGPPPPLMPWVKHRTIQQIYNEPLECVLCRMLYLEPNSKPGKEMSYDSADLREVFFSPSTYEDEHTNDNDIIWMKIRANYIEIFPGNHTKPVEYRKSPKWTAYFSVRNVTGKYDHLKTVDTY